MSANRLPLSQPRPRGTAQRLILVSSVGYVLAWIAGLSVGAPSPPLDAPGAAISAAIAVSPAKFMLQVGLVEGLAGLLLLILVLSVAAVSDRNARSLKLFVACGILAGAISLTMCVSGLALGRIVGRPSGDPLVGHLFHIMNRLDGPKMVLLAATALAGIYTQRWLPVWTKALAWALAASLAASGFAYGLLIEPLAWTAYISGVLLLAWIAIFGIQVGLDRGNARPSKAPLA
jgi:hypothetical protein